MFLQRFAIKWTNCNRVSNDPRVQPNPVGRDAADSIIRRDCNRAGCTARKNGQARYPHGEKVRVIDGKQTKYPSIPRADQRPWNRDKKTAKQFSTLFSDAHWIKWGIMPTRCHHANLSLFHIFQKIDLSPSCDYSWHLYVTNIYHCYKTIYIFLL